MKNTKKIYLIGLGFFTVTAAWAVYNAFVPIFLDRLINNTILIGAIMTFDNAFGVIFQPLFGSLSDKTNTKLGRRMPYLIFGIPIAAIGLSFIPFYTGIATLITAIIVMNFAMSVYRAPVVAMMPDCTPENERSKANGIINLMGGLGTVIAFLLGGMLFDINEKLPFAACSAVMLLALFIIAVFYKEPEKIYESENNNDKEKSKWHYNGISSVIELIKEYSELLLILIAIFFWYCGYNAIETYLSLYCTYVLHITPGEASFIFALLAGSFLISSIPAGYIGEKFGRLKSMILGLVIISFCLGFIIIYPQILVVQILMVISGFSWALIIINSYPYIIGLAPEKKTGKYTGLYYFFSFFASIVSPLIFGAIAELQKDYRMLFVYSEISFVTALLFLILMYFLKKKNIAINKK